MLGSFGETAKGLSRNPLGILALFIVLVYGFAALVTAFGGGLTADEKRPLVYFLVLFPILVLGVFAWLVSRHPGNLYSPADFKNEDNFVRVVASLAAASVQRPGGNAAVVEADFQEIVEVVREVAPSRAVLSDSRSNHVLWVDDRPENNVYERRAFEGVGIKFTLALSTDQALDVLRLQKFAAIISDMGRQEGQREGYVLLDAVRTQGDTTPFFIYAGSDRPEHKTEAASHGGQGSTNNPQELFRMVTAVVLMDGHRN